MGNGSIVLNGVTEKQIIEILKAQEEKKIAFNITGVQQAATPHGTTYGHVSINWGNDEGLKNVLALVHKVLESK